MPDRSESELPATGIATRTRASATVATVAASTRQRVAGWLRPRRWVLVGFAVSRVAAFAVGIRFDPSWLALSPQYLDEGVLRDRLLESVFYQHTQPPLLNLGVGTLLRVSPFGTATTMGVAWMACGVLTALLLYDLGRWVQLGPKGATAAVLVIMCLPDTLLVENNSMYDYPSMTLAVASVWAFVRYVQGGSTRRLAALAGVLGVLVLTRTLFHPLWYVAVMVVAMVLRHPPRWSKAIVCAAVPLLLIVAVVVKNQVVFGSPSLTSFFGMNIGRVTVENIPTADRERLIQDGTLTPAARTAGFLPEANYRDLVPPCERHHPDVPALSRPAKASGDPNLNDECYLPVYDVYARNATAAARAVPGDAAASVALGGQIFFMPVALGPFYNNNRAPIAGYIALQQVAEGVVRLPVPRTRHALIGLVQDDGTLEFGLTDLVFVVLVLVLAAGAMRRVVRRRSNASDLAHAAVGLMVGYVLLVGTVLEVGENYRFRYVIEPMVLLVAFAAVGRLVKRRQVQRAERLGTP